jgi:ribosomal protein S18 acetylase RimI-like enzyme
MNIDIRPARRGDAPHVATLMDIAGHGIEAEFWSANVDEDRSPSAAARRLVIEDPTVPYHLSRAWMITVDGEVAGALIGRLIAGSEAIHGGFPDYFAPLLALEARVPGFWTVVGLAVYREFRGLGLARRLLDHAERLGREERAAGLSIVVEDTNTAALSLYRRVGFVERETRSWLAYGTRTGPSAWVLLTRPF